MKKILAVFIASILLAPAYVGAQSSGIVLLDSFGEFSKGDSVFIYGNAGLPEPDSYLILKITNPRGDICQIQQILPLQDGTFVMDKVPLRGNVCGLDGLYEIEVLFCVFVYKFAIQYDTHVLKWAHKGHYSCRLKIPVRGIILRFRFSK